MFITSVLNVSQQKHLTAWPLSSNSGRSDIQLRAVFEEYKSVLLVGMVRRSYSRRAASVSERLTSKQREVNQGLYILYELPKLP